MCMMCEQRSMLYATNYIHKIYAMWSMVYGVGTYTNINGAARNVLSL